MAEALILPLAQEMPQSPGPEAGRYLEFLAHVFLTSPAQVGDILRRYEAGDARWMAVASAALPHIPRRILETRRFLMGRHVVVSLAAFQRRGLGTGDVGFEAYLSDMMDAVAGYLSAPPSERTLDLARERDGRTEVCEESHVELSPRARATAAAAKAT